MNTVKLFLVRHGTTHYNMQKRIQGDALIEKNLTSAGRKEVKALARRLLELDVNFDRIICSPLKRCQETLDIINQIRKKSTEPLEIEPRIRERSFGELHHQPSTEFIAARSRFVGLPEDYCPVEGESLRSLYNRVQEWFLCIKNEIAELQQSQCWLVVSHGGPLSCLQAMIEGKSVREVVFQWPNASLRCLELNGRDLPPAFTDI